MSQTAETFASLDTQLAAAKAAWEVEKQTMQDRIFALETELNAAKDQGRVAVEGRMVAEANAGALHALFAVVRHVLDEAEARKHDDGNSKPPSEHIKTQLAKVDAAVGASKPLSGFEEAQV